MTRGYKGQLFSLFVPLFTLPTQQDCVLPVVNLPSLHALKALGTFRRVS